MYVSQLGKSSCERAVNNAREKREDYRVKFFRAGKRPSKHGRVGPRWEPGDSSVVSTEKEKWALK